MGSFDGVLFRKLRPHGTYFSRIKPDNGVQILLDAVEARAKVHPVRYGHWYIDRGEPADHDSSLTLISYSALESARAALLGKVQAEIERPGMGPEMLRTIMAGLRPGDLNMNGGDEVLKRFQAKALDRGIRNSTLQHKLRTMGRSGGAPRERSRCLSASRRVKGRSR